MSGTARTFTWRDHVRQQARETACFWRHLGHRWQRTGEIVHTRVEGITAAKECVNCGAWRSW